MKWDTESARKKTSTVRTITAENYEAARFPTAAKAREEADQRGDQPPGVGSQRPATIRRSSGPLGPPSNLQVGIGLLGRDGLDPRVEGGPSSR